MLLFAAPALRGASAYAEDAALPAEMLPASMPPLPSARDRSGGLLLVSDTVEPYKDLFAPPVYDWIKARRMVVRAVRGLESAWTLTEGWQTASKGPETRFQLTKDFGIEKNPAVPDQALGFPFGDRELLNAEADPQARAYKILWNALFTARMSEELRYTFEMTWSGSQILRRRADAFWYGRFFPQLQNEQPFLSQWVFRFLTPPGSQNYSLLSWDFRDNTQSRFWIYSPPIQRLRELLPANRSDGILASNLNTDDLFVWSGDFRRFSVKVLEERQIFVLFPSVRSYQLVPQSGEVLAPETPDSSKPSASPTPAESASPPAAGSAAPKPSSASLPSLAVTGLKDRSFGGGPAAVLWNYDTKQFPQLAPWVPLSVSAVPRKVWVIELVPKDPFYEAGRILLSVDQEMMLPVMKVTYDRIGEFQKIVMGGWGLAEKKDRSLVLPFFAFAMSAEQDASAVTAITATSIKRLTPKEGAGLKTLHSLLQPESYGKPRETPARKADESGKGPSKEAKPSATISQDEHAAAID